MEHAHDTQLTKLLRYAKDASPEGLRAAVRPVVRRVLPEHIRARLRDQEPADLYAVPDAWVDNRYTIVDEGVRRHFFFINGCFKSGTNWVQNLLNLHPHAFVRGEYHFEVARYGLDHLTKVDWFVGRAQEMCDIADETFEMLVRRMMYEGWVHKPEAVWIGDRTPNPLLTIIRGAPQINIIRDCRDVLISWSYHHLRIENEVGAILKPFREKWREARDAYLADPEGFNPVDGLLGHEPWLRYHAREWASMARRSRLLYPQLVEEGTPVLLLRYEQMHQDLETQRLRLYGFLDLDPSLAEPPSVGTKTLPGFRASGPMDFYRKGAVGEWQGVLTPEVIAIIKEEAGEELVHAGYEEGLNW